MKLIAIFLHSTLIEYVTTTPTWKDFPQTYKEQTIFFKLSVGWLGVAIDESFRLCV